MLAATPCTGEAAKDPGRRTLRAEMGRGIDGVEGAAVEEEEEEDEEEEEGVLVPSVDFEGREGVDIGLRPLTFSCP